MKRKTQPRDERRRPQVELNMSDEPKLLGTRRRGCLPWFGSILAVAAAVAILVAGLR
jgi:hypothetical protein